MVSLQTGTRSRDEQVVKPVFVIDRAVELMSRRNGMFSAFGSGTIGHEVVKENPSADMQFGRAPVAMEVT